MLISRPLSLSLSVLCSVQCAGRVSLKALCPSFPDLRVSGGGMGLWGDTVSLPPSCLMMVSTGALGPVSIPVPSRGTPAGNSSKIWVLTLLFQCPKGSWVPGLCAWAQEMPPNESSNQASQMLCRHCWGTIKRPASPGLSRLETKERSQSWQRYQRFNRWDVLHIWSKRILERQPLWIAGDRQKTAAAALFTRRDRESTSYSGNEQQVGSMVKLVTMETSKASHPSLSPSG